MRRPSRSAAFIHIIERDGFAVVRQSTELPTCAENATERHVPSLRVEPSSFIPQRDTASECGARVVVDNRRPQYGF